MGTEFFAAFMMLLLTISGGSTPGVRHNDLLDMIPTDAYWQAKHVTVTREQLEADIGAPKPAGDVAQLVKNLESLSKRDEAKKQLLAAGTAALEPLRAETKSADPEAAAMAADIIQTLSQHAKEREVRRLMAIRTLGEQEKESLPVLNGLVDSKDMFVAEYANRAIAEITGTPAKAQEVFGPADDLKLLPASTGMVGQTTGLGLPGFNIDTLLAQMAGVNSPEGVARAPVDKVTTRGMLVGQLLDIIDAVGNCRVDGVTVAVSADIGGSANEWVVMSFHGTYDRQAIADYAAKMSPNHQVQRVGEVVRIDLDQAAVMVMPSDHQLVMVSANPGDTPMGTILDPLMECLTTGKPGTLADNKDLDALLKTVDKSGVAWVAGIPSAKMRTEPIMGPFNTVAIEAKEDKGMIKLSLTARGTGAAQSAVDAFETGRGELLQDQGMLLGMSKDFQPFLDAVKSVQLMADDKGATGTATVPPEIVKSAIAAIISNFRLTQPPMNRTLPPAGMELP